MKETKGTQTTQSRSNEVTVNGQKPENAYPVSLAAQFESQCEKYADIIALHTKYRTYTFAELNGIVNRIAWAILEDGIRGNHGVAILFEDSGKMIPAMLGVLKSGSYYVAIDTSFPRERIQLMLTDSEAQTLVTITKHLGLVREVAPSRMNIINIDKLNLSRESKNPGLSIAPETRLSLVYTSGSSGIPKGIINTHADRLRPISRKYIHPGARIAMLFSPSFAAGGWAIFRALLDGASLYDYDIKTEGLADFADWLRENKITNLGLTPSIFRQLAAMLGQEDKFPELQVIGLGAETILNNDVELYKRHFSEHAALRVTYASSEVGLITHQFYDGGSQLPEGPVPLGFPATGRIISILDDNNQEAADGEMGEIIVGGNGVHPSYWRQTEHTQKAFLPDPNV